MPVSWPVHPAYDQKKDSSMPAWKLEGSGLIEGAPNPPEPFPERPPDEVTAYDPGDHTVADVQDFVQDNPDEAQAILDAETAGKDRVTLTTWLTDFIDGT